MNEQKNNYYFTFLISFVIGCSLLAYSFAQEPTITIPERGTITNSQTWNIETWSELTWVKEVSVTRPVIVSKPRVIYTGWTNWSNQEISTWWTQLVLRRGNEQAKEIATYMWAINPDPVMIATFIAESGLNPRSKSPTGDHWICQLNYTYNNVFINDPRWSTDDRHRQAETCVWKRQNANHNLWMAYANWPYKKFLQYIN